MAEFNQEQLDLLKDRLIEELGLQARDLACLKRMHINTIGDLLKINKSEMILLDTLGKLSISHIEERLYVYTVTSDAKEHIEKEPEVNIPSSPNWDSVRKKDEEEEKDPLDASILDLEISTKAYYTLRFSNLDTIRKIVSKDEFDLKRINRKRFSDEIIEDIKKSIIEYAVQHHIETEIDGSPLFRVNHYNEKFIEEGHTTEPETADAENIEIPCEKSIAEIPEKDKVEADEKPNKKETTEIRITANKTPQNVYNPLRAPISDLNIKSKSYHALKSAEFRIVLDVLQHRKSYLENEYPKITPEILEDIDKAIRRLTSDHGCLSLALSFPFFAADAVSEKTEDDRNQLSRCIIDILKDQKLQGRKWITAHNIDAILNDEYPSIARVVTPKQIMEILELSENVRKNDLYYQYTDDAEETSETDTSERENSKSIAESILVEDERMNEESEPEADKDSGEITKEETNFLTLKRIVDTIEWVDPVETNPVSDNEESFEYAEIDQVETTTYETESLPNGYEPSITTEPEEDEPVVSEIELVEAEILDSAEEDVADSVDNSMSADASNHEERISTNLPEYRVKFFSWEKEDAGTLPVSRDESTDTQESSAGTIDAGDEKKLPDPIDEEISNEDTQQPPMHLHEVRHIMASDYSQERIEEINNSEKSDALITTEIFKKKDNEEKNEVSEMISIKEAIKVLPKGYQWTINCRLEGMKTQEIADKAGVTKQRISEILRKGMYAVFHGTKSIKAIDRVAEDDDRELFENYNISLAEWTEHLHKPVYAYHYLKLRYKKGDKPLPGSGSHRSTNKPLGLTRTPDGIKGVVNRGRLEDLLDYYKILGALDRDVVLYSDEEEFTKGIKKLCRMINREIKRKKYISDIRITDHEYTMLRGYLHYAIMMLNKTGIAPDDAMFATAVTNVAIKIYKDGNLWGNFFKEVQLKQTPATQKNIGIKFYEVLEKFDLVRGDAGEYFQNILMHCFVSDYYANSYFDFLFNFYRIDLERDLSRLDTETMRAFMDSICSEENEGRTYMLVQHISQAMAANRRGATIRIRNHMKLLDKFFWDDTFEITTTHRLYNLMQKWAKSSKDVIGEMEAYSTGRRRGAKRFSQPYIRYMGAENSFMLVIPPQSIKRIESEEIYWNVSGGINRRLDVELMDSVIGYKVLESRNYIPFDSVLDSFQLELCTAEGQSIKKFNIRKQDVRFFDDDGYPINSNSIKTGEVTAVSRVSNIVRSSALYDSEEINGLLLSYFNFEFEDILHMPDGHVVIIGRPEITNSIAGKGRIEGAVCYMDERKYDLYGRVPYLVLRMKSSRFAGTAITINGKKQRLSDIEYESFTIDDKTDDVGYYVDLNNYLDGRDDVYRIDVDIPGGSSPHWEFVYIKDFAVEFDEAPYVFEPRGTVVFPEHIKIKEIEDFCEKEPGVNGYKFTIKEVSRTLDFVTSVGEHDVDISIPVPAFFIKNQNGEWDSNIPAPVWHADLPDVIDLAVPYHKVTLYMDDVFTDGSDSGRELTYRRNIGDDHILCDISKFKSYLTGDDIARQLRMRFGEVDSNLFTIIIHSKVISLQILGNFDTNDITVNADISGKADYYIDIRKGDEIIAEKIPLIDGTARYNHEIGNGIYEVEVFELADDDSGFGGEDYYSIGVYDQEMMNPYDMTDRSFKIIQVEEKGNPLAVLPIRYNYYVLDLKKTDDNHIYNGMMLVRKSFFKGSEIASFPVSVSFDDLNKPNYVWISFIDEDYGDRLDFLYDTRKQGILQEENELLRSMVCYRRYTFLNDEEYIYHIDFCDEHYKNEYNSLAKSIVFNENSNQIVFKEKTIYNKEKARFEWKPSGVIRIDDTQLDPVYKMRLKKARINTLNDLSKMSFTEATRIRNIGFTVLKAAQKEMKRYGLDFREED